MPRLTPSNAHRKMPDSHRTGTWIGGRSLDVHALRTTAGTYLNKNGVAPRTAQAFMRHSSIDLTMNVYTDPQLLEVRKALDALPELPLEGSPDMERKLATGTFDGRALAPTLAPNLVQASTSQSSKGKSDAHPRNRPASNETHASAIAINTRRPLSFADNGRPETGDLGFEPRLTDPESVVLPLH